MKTHFPKLKPNVVNYRDYKNFVNNYFRSELLQEISSDSDITNFKDLQYTLQGILVKHAPREATVLIYCILKQKYHESIDISKISDKKTFSKTASPLFSNVSY